MRLISTKGTRDLGSVTRDEAIAEAVAMETELQPAYGVTVDDDGVTIAEVRDGEVVD